MLIVVPAELLFDASSQTVFVSSVPFSQVYWKT